MEQKQRLIHFWRENFKFNSSVVNAFEELDRSIFVPERLQKYSYQDTPLPLFRGKTISQPTTVMVMSSALELNKGYQVYEVGTGSGYQSAIIAKVIGDEGRVVSTEVIPELVGFAKKNLAKAGIKNVSVFEEDGSKGLPEKGMFDRIIITAACKEFPKVLLDQLKPGGLIVGPVGDRYEQEMVKGIKHKDGHLELHFLGQFLFTPMYGKYGFEI